MSASLLRFLLASALAMPLLAHAQIYKWTDAKGAVNYGAKPPRNAVNVTTLEAESRLSIIPTAIPRQPPRPSQSADEMWQARAAQLERTAVPSVYDRPMFVAVPDPAAWRERCFAELRVDCDRPTAATYDYIPGFQPSDLGSPFGRGRW